MTFDLKKQEIMEKISIVDTISEYVDWSFSVMSPQEPEPIIVSSIFDIGVISTYQTCLPRNFDYSFAIRLFQYNFAGNEQAYFRVVE